MLEKAALGEGTIPPDFVGTEKRCAALEKLANSGGSGAEATALRKELAVAKSEIAAQREFLGLADDALALD